MNAALYLLSSATGSKANTLSSICDITQDEGVEFLPSWIAKLSLAGE